MVGSARELLLQNLWIFMEGDCVLVGVLVGALVGVAVEV